MSVGARMKKARNEFGYTQEEIASLIGVNRSHVSNVENGNDMPSNTYVKLFAIKLGVSESWLESGYGEMKPSFLRELDKNDIEAIWNSSSGYIVKYVILQRLLCPSIDIDSFFQDITHNDNLIILLNYIMDKCFSANVSPIKDYEAYTENIVNNVEDYLEYKRRYAERKKSAITHRNSHMQPIWKEAEDIERRLLNYTASSLSISMGIGEFLHMEDKLLNHRLFGKDDEDQQS